MNRERIRVAKLGGSLLGLDQLPDRIDRSVAAIRPIVFAVVGRLRFVADRRARRTRAFTVRVDIINEDAVKRTASEP